MTSRASNEASQIGYWSEIKLDIIKEYARAYSAILSRQTRPALKHVYVDAFSGTGVHQSKDGDLVWGSPTSVLLVEPPFKEYHFIDLDEGSIDTLRMQVEQRTTGPYDPQSVHFYNADCNEVLLSTIFPRIKFRDYARGLCLLDPYGLDLDWQVLHAAGQMKSIEIFLNFPIMDMNRNVLWRDPQRVDVKQSERLSRFWGDDSWRDAAYSTEQNLFGFEEKTTNDTVVAAFRKRLTSVAGFSYVPPPIPMRNTRGATVYYLFFASPKPVAAKIVSNIFDKYRSRRS